MFLGHFGVGFGAKRFAPGVSLGALFVACQLADLLWPNLVLLGVERLEIEPGATRVTPLDFVSYPYSHSLVGLAIWAALFAGLYWIVRRSPLRAAVVIAAAVLSHWVLDVVSHRPDMPLTLRGGPLYGLGLWNSLPATLATELGLLALGVFLYVRATRPVDRKGRLALGGLLVFLVAVYLASLLGPPPPSPGAVAWGAQAMWLVVLWGYWVDRHRVARAPAART
jgi:hypothetical protein